MNSKLILIVLLLLLPLAMAKQPIQEAEGTDLLEIRFPQTEFVPLATPIKIHSHVFNQSSGLKVTNETTDCFVHLYSHTGHHILEENMSFDGNGIEFELEINDSIFVVTGQHSYIIQCNNTGGVGGFVSGSFFITESGHEEVVLDNTSGFSVVMFIMFCSLIFLILPFIVEKFSKSTIANLVIRRASWLLGIYLLMFNSAIVASIASASNLPVTQELFRYMWLFGTFGYLFMGYLVLKTLFDVLTLYKIGKGKERMGDDD